LYSGRSVPHYKACADGSKDGFTDTFADIHAAMATIPLETGFCAERWRHDMGVVLEKIPCIARRDHIRCNRSNNRNQGKGGESGTPHVRVPSDGRWNFKSTQKDYENKIKTPQ
jgi:hypothetical protein